MGVSSSLSVASALFSSVVMFPAEINRNFILEIQQHGMSDEDHHIQNVIQFERY